MGRTRVAVAMSGGVDSSLSAALLQEAGYEVMGVTMQLWCEERYGLSSSSRPTCCSLKDIQDARIVCHFLDIPFYVVNVEAEFRASVVDYFCDEYVRGRTPNPCIVCNQRIKFDFLLNRILSMGAEYLATGHYARIVNSEGEYCLLKGLDPSSDQSYFLYTLGQTELRHLLFPVGGYFKSQVRQMAAERRLSVAEKPKSQDLCFVPDGNYEEFIQARVSSVPGEIVDEGGRVLGKHQGIAFYTIGQRTGLGIATGRRLYVHSIDADNNVVVVGPEDKLFVSSLHARSVRFVGDGPQQPVAITAKIRYNSPGTSAMLYPFEGRAEVMFQERQRAVAPGQAVVFYQGDEVLGGGVIEAS